MSHVLPGEVSVGAARETWCVVAHGAALGAVEAEVLVDAVTV
jgi:hypothetical protein